MISASAFFLAILSFVLVAGIGTSQAQNAPETCSLDDPIQRSLYQEEGIVNQIWKITT